MKLLQTSRAGQQMESSLGGWSCEDPDRDTGKVDARVTDLCQKVDQLGGALEAEYVSRVEQWNHFISDLAIGTKHAKTVFAAIIRCGSATSTACESLHVDHAAVIVDH